MEFKESEPESGRVKGREFNNKIKHLKGTKVFKLTHSVGCSYPFLTLEIRDI